MFMPGIGKRVRAKPNLLTDFKSAWRHALIFIGLGPNEDSYMNSF